MALRELTMTATHRVQSIRHFMQANSYSQYTDEGKACLIGQDHALRPCSAYEHHGRPATHSNNDCGPDDALMDEA